MKNKLTIKQTGFVRDYLETGNATEAIRRNYGVIDDSTARAMGSENLAKPNIQQSILEALVKNGLTNEHLAEKIAELVNAQKKITILKNGEVEMIREQIDIQAVKAGLEFVFKLKFKEGEEHKSLTISDILDEIELSRDQI